jgi:cell division initiation protein
MEVAMITPAEIQEKDFPKGVRGYKEEEVDKFLDLITLDFEKLIKENVRLKAEIAALELEQSKNKGSESSVIETLQAAKALMNDISVSAEKRAEILLKNAEMDAELIVREAREAAVRIETEHKSLKQSYTSFRDRYQQLLETELSRVESLTSGLFPEFAAKTSHEATVDKSATVNRGISIEDFEMDIAQGKSFDRNTIVKVK